MDADEEHDEEQEPEGPLHVSAFPDHDAVGVSVRFLAENCMSVIGHASRNIADGLTLVQDDREDLSRFHGLQFQLGLDEIIWADDATQVQLRIRPLLRALMFHVGFYLQTHSVYPLMILAGPMVARK